MSKLEDRVGMTVARKDHYTMGELATMFAVSPRTASKMVDDGTIQGFRLPGRQVRRVLHRTLLKFVADHPEYGFALEKIKDKA
jgi:hypothetical protein